MQAKGDIQQGLVATVEGESNPSVRRAASDALAAAARCAVPSGEWPQLLPWVHGLSSAASPLQREAALVLLCSLLDTIGAFLVHSYPWFTYADSS